MLFTSFNSAFKDGLCAIRCMTPSAVSLDLTQLKTTWPLCSAWVLIDNDRDTVLNYFISLVVYVYLEKTMHFIFKVYELFSKKIPLIILLLHLV